MKPVKNAIAYVIYDEGRTKILAVQRPSDDESLPDAWGLPAGSLKEGETFEQAVFRSGKEKLGVTLGIIGFIGEGEIERKDLILYMKEYEAEIIKGEPKVPQNVKEFTQYQKWKWASPSILADSARKGSLCSRIYLESINYEY